MYNLSTQSQRLISEPVVGVVGEKFWSEYGISRVDRRDGQTIFRLYRVDYVDGKFVNHHVYGEKASAEIADKLGVDWARTIESFT